MKHKYRSALSLLLTVLLCCACAVPALAADTVGMTEVFYYEDGSYLTVEAATYNPCLSRASNTVSGKKTGTYRDSNGNVLWDFTVDGTFTYNGSTATATKATYSYNIYDSAWTLKSANAYCSGNQAIADATFNGGLLLNRSTSVTLSCSGTGVLS